MKSDSFLHCKNTEITDVSTFAFKCYFMTEAPKGSREQKIYFDPIENFLMHFKWVMSLSLFLVSLFVS